MTWEQKSRLSAQEIHRLKTGGVPVPEIAARAGVSRARVYQILQRLKDTVRDDHSGSETSLPPYTVTGAMNLYATLIDRLPNHIIDIDLEFEKDAQGSVYFGVLTNIRYTITPKRAA